MALTHKQIFNKKHGFKLNQSHSLAEIAKLSGYKLAGIKTIYEKGVGAFYTNPESVRKSVKSPEQWGFARTYSAVNPDSKAHQIDKSHLKKR